MSMKNKIILVGLAAMLCLAVFGQNKKTITITTISKGDTSITTKVIEEDDNSDAYAMAVTGKNSSKIKSANSDSLLKSVRKQMEEIKRTMPKNIGFSFGIDDDGISWYDHWDHTKKNEVHEHEKVKSRIHRDSSKNYNDFTYHFDFPGSKQKFKSIVLTEGKKNIFHLNAATSSNATFRLEIKDDSQKSVYLKEINDGKAFNEKIDLNNFKNGKYTLLLSQNGEMLIEQTIERTK